MVNTAHLQAPPLRIARLTMRFSQPPRRWIQTWPHCPATPSKFSVSYPRSPTDPPRFSHIFLTVCFLLSTVRRNCLGGEEKIPPCVSDGARIYSVRLEATFYVSRISEYDGIGHLIVVQICECQVLLCSALSRVLSTSNNE